ncbi:MAG: hypothetical protein PHU43_06245 [Candidatus Bipolaricaulis sp.]|nr:hypothetical protein [Candidatus Bipolaricaulis sp.]
MLETKSEGPPGEPAHTDLMVHLLAMLHVLFADATLTFRRASFARAVGRGSPEVTYARAEGELSSAQMGCPFYLEVGKQLPVDEKALGVFGPSGEHRVDLSVSQAWSYDDLVSALLAAADREAPLPGTVSAALQHHIWEELTALSAMAGPVEEYMPGTWPDSRT